ncbi:MAG: hypothetical protein ACKVI4_17905 [Actinomycetales bacterium]
MSNRVNFKPITVTLDPVDLDLLDRLAKLEGKNRSQELRGMLEGMRPMLTATVEALEAALRQRDAFDQATSALVLSEFGELLPELENLNRQYLGAMSRIEGSEAVKRSQNPRPSNHGGHTPTPTPPGSTE